MSSFKEPEEVINVMVEGYQPFNVDSLKSDDITIIEDHKDRLLIRASGKNIDVRILDINYQNGTYKLRLNGKTFSCTAQTNLDLLIKELGFNQVKKSQEKEIFAPMPGMVLDVQVNEASQVDEDQILLTLEAMKMENIIKSSQKGIIETVHIRKGDKVEKNQLLITFR